jgi:hypothetical protein
MESPYIGVVIEARRKELLPWPLGARCIPLVPSIIRFTFTQGMKSVACAVNLFCVGSISCLKIFVVLSSQHIFNVHDLDLLGVAMSFGFNTPPRVNLNFATSGTDRCDDFCCRFRSSALCHCLSQRCLFILSLIQVRRFVKRKKWGQERTSTLRVGTRSGSLELSFSVTSNCYAFVHMLYAYCTPNSTCFAYATTISATNPYGQKASGDKRQFQH